MGMRETPSIRDSAQLCVLFDALFLESENTRLLAGGEEPVYLPAGETHKYHRIVFRHDYIASALHEIAHWCIAGPERRRRVDYGYWYAPDGRDVQAQQEFERIEARPQALEWILSEACGLRFRPSMDNLDGAAADADAFSLAIAGEARRMLAGGLPPRAARLLGAVLRQTGRALSAMNFDASRLV